MAPAATSKSAKSENSKAVKVLEELLGKLSLSKSPEDIQVSSHELATYINGDIQEGDAPTA